MLNRGFFVQKGECGDGGEKCSQCAAAKTQAAEAEGMGCCHFAFFCVVAASFYMGFLTGCSWQQNKAQEMRAEDSAIAYDSGQKEDEWEKEDNSRKEEAGADDSRWYLTLVNEWNPLPNDYQADLVETEGGERVDARIYEPLTEMLEDAREANWDQLPMVVSGYRTTEKQQQLYEEKTDTYRQQGYSDADAETMAKKWVAMPGYSEHQLGLAVDINGATYDLYLWLQENSYKYGFIFRYPGHKTELTGVAEEVWHYRYVGAEAATEIYEQGICLEEYVERMNQ